MARPTAQDALTEEELDRLLAQPNLAYPTGKRNLALLLVMADAGLRVAEATSLNTTDLVWENGQLTYILIRKGKGGKQGKVALTSRSAVALAGWLQAREALGLGTGPIFCTISKGQASGYFAEEGQRLVPGRALSTAYVGQMVKRLAEKADIEKNISPHTLRHTFATRLLRSGQNLAVVQKAMRHSQIQTTVDIYGHLDQADVDAAIGQLPGSEEKRGVDEEIAAKRQHILEEIEQLKAMVGV